MCLSLTLSATLAAAQPVRISGRVSSAATGEPLPGVTVTVSGVTTRGAVTLDGGNYEIEASDGETLVFSSLGYKAVRILLDGRHTVDVALEYDATRIDELVVVGYGTMKKSDLTGAVGSVSGETLKKAPVATVTEALQGRAAGVTVTSDTGQPGSGATIRIRGIGSITSGSAPLYVVDGMIVDNINFLSPNDISSTEILKDASSAAIYGSRAANGVILITTKTGKKSDRMNITFDAYAGVQSRWNKLDLMGRDEFIRTYLDINSGFGGTVNQAQIDSYNNGGINLWLLRHRINGSEYYPVPDSSYNYGSTETDWQDAVFVKNAPIQNYYISFDGGSDKTTYALSANYFNQKGTIIGSYYDRLNFRLNTSYQARKWLKVGETLSFSTSRSRWAMNNDASPGASILSAALAMGPWDPTHYPAGSVNARGKDLGGRISASSLYSQGTNPFIMEQYSHNRDNSHNWLGSLYAELTPFKGFTFHSDVSFNFNYDRTRSFNEAYATQYQSRPHSVGQGSSFGQTLNFNNYATWARTFGKHDFSVMAGHTVEMSKYEGVSVGKVGLLNISEGYWVIDKATGYNDVEKKDEVPTHGGYYNGEIRRMSLLSRLYYQYDNRYMVMATFRADANRTFKQLWGYFPSVSVAWRLSEEAWLKDFRTLSQLKMRVGWGMLGNDNVLNNLSTREMYTSGNMFVGYILGGNQSAAPGAAETTLKNESVAWEGTQHINVGVDFGFWQNRLSGTVDWFVRDTRAMLMYRKIPYYAMDLFYPMVNIGTMRNTGVEFSLEYHDNITVGRGPLSWSIGGNMSFVKNKVLSTSGADRVFGDRTITDQGYAVNSFWGYRYEGIYRTQEELDAHLWGGNAKGFKVGDSKFEDLNGDGMIDEQNDMTVIGNPFPKFTYGFNAQAAYFGFDLQMFFQGVHGNMIYNALRERTEGSGQQSQLSTSMRNVWTEKNPTGTIPNPLNSVNRFNNSRFLESGSYLRLKNMQLGYTLSPGVTRKMGIEKFRIYLSASNLFTLTKYTGYDPEVGAGVDYGNYPQSRTFMLGVNINF